MTITLKSFQSSLNRVLSSFECPPKNVAIALSGGPDSMLLTWFLSEFKRTSVNLNQLNIHAITIDHNYRYGSDVEASSLTQHVEKWGVNHVIKKLEYNVQDPKTITNFEEIARIKRYEIMNTICNDLGAPALFLGHHQDDQLETFIQRLQGNSSIFGLAGTRSIATMPLTSDLNPSKLLSFQRVKILRPFLSFTKQEILRTCQTNQIPYVIDPTNSDINLTRRNYLRKVIGETLPDKLKEFESKHGSSELFPYKSIMKDEIIKTHQSCVNLVEDFERKAYLMHRSLSRSNKIHESPSFSKLLIELPKNYFAGTNKITVSRFLYQRLYPYSTLNHYHWAYAKLERQLVPKIANWLNMNRPTPLKCTMMNLKFNISTKPSSVYMEITRAPLTRSEVLGLEQKLNIDENWSKWFLFDKRFWLRFRSKKKEKLSIVVIPYSHKLHCKMVGNSLKLKYAIDSRMDALPIVMQDGKILSFPTLETSASEIDSEWSTKYNKFDYLVN
ncbi:uncharacterized protein KGF55_002927 [Candida pseudojiufengensis]|uniref:uncharacterized protein n=1 Tax=Candida pseudojiufengensis TaxID=497109 RepID=UPI002224EE69|nr:uncharacterized protein KGF55_002927 [Candida pseudojiufengensis]KAI5963135.1 hypothetical protein KGF55_002927 [Candida pseudojiufengensis]